MYNESSKKATAKYCAEKREQLKLNLAKGIKEEWKRQAAEKGYPSLTAYIKDLIEKDK